MNPIAERLAPKYPLPAWLRIILIITAGGVLAANALALFVPALRFDLILITGYLPHGLLLLFLPLVVSAMAAMLTSRDARTDLFRMTLISGLGDAEIIQGYWAAAFARLRPLIVPIALLLVAGLCATAAGYAIAFASPYVATIEGRQPISRALRAITLNVPLSTVLMALACHTAISFGVGFGIRSSAAVLWALTLVGVAWCLTLFLNTLFITPLSFVLADPEPRVVLPGLILLIAAWAGIAWAASRFALRAIEAKRR